MSPTPFHPTHTTPFKSSISSSQQVQKRPTKSEEASGSTSSTSNWPASLNVKSLDSRHWTYLAEGGKNLLLRYEGPREYPYVSASGSRIALRLTKVDRGDSSKIGNGEIEEDIEALKWRDSVLIPDLSPVGNLPPLLRVQDGSPNDEETHKFLKQVASKVEVARPIERRKKSGLDEMGKQGIFVTEDLSASITGMQTISFEVKPKCGFLPSTTAPLSAETSGLKRRYSRYRMHRILKSKSPPSLEEFVDYYDPLDLYSGDQGRVQKAAKVLYKDWLEGEGNLRVFVNGKRAESSEVNELNELVKSHFQSQSLEDMVCSVLASSEAHNLLQRLVQLQEKYDSIDVEGVSALYQAEKGTDLTNSNEAPVSLSEYQEAVLKKATEPNQTAREAIVKLLLSAMYKDCSIFIRCTSSSKSTDSIMTSLYLVDLDPKPVKKLSYFEQLDKDVIHNFRGWAKHVGLPE